VPKISVMLAGLCGNTASTFVASMLELSNESTRPACATSSGPLGELDLLAPRDIAISGWDFSSDNLCEVVSKQRDLPRFSEATMQRLAQIRALPGLQTALDLPPEQIGNYFEVSNAGETIEILASNIQQCAIEAEAACSIVIYLGSPHSVSTDAASMPSDVRAVSWEEVREHPKAYPSSLFYGLAAARAGGHFVDFTPGLAMESKLLHDAAHQAGVQLAGRDGSTGQTYLKLWLAEALHARGIKISAWYSTNVLGNHDGYVLSKPEHAVVKLADKRDGLGAILGYPVEDHYVNIDYVPEWGDRKESWDSVLASGWFDAQIDLKINWRGVDSLLAAPVLFDLIRLLEYGGRYGLAGLRPELGFFFKRPLGREGASPSALYGELISNYVRLAKK
jgi:myo-inositol-1-phosphate synthase